MSSVYNYTFDSMSRMGYDVSTLSEKNKQNTHYGSYSLMDYFEGDCGLRNQIAFSTQQPNINILGGKNTVGKGGCVVNDHSELTIGTIQTNPKSTYKFIDKTVFNCTISWSWAFACLKMKHY